MRLDQLGAATAATGAWLGVPGGIPWGAPLGLSLAVLGYLTYVERNRHAARLLIIGKAASGLDLDATRAVLGLSTPQTTSGLTRSPRPTRRRQTPQPPEDGA